MPPRQLPLQGCYGAGKHSHTFSMLSFVVRGRWMHHFKLIKKWIWSAVENGCFSCAFAHLFFSHYNHVPPGQLSPRMMHFTHHTQAVKFSVVHRVSARTGIHVVQRLRSSVLRYYCFNIVQQKWVAMLLLLRCDSRIKSYGKRMDRT